MDTPSYYSAGAVCEALQCTPNELSAVAWEANVRPAYKADNIAYYSNADLATLFRFARGELTSRSEQLTDPTPTPVTENRLVKMVREAVEEELEKARRQPEQRIGRAERRDIES